MSTIIALEGLDGCGKTRQLELLSAQLKKRGSVLRMDFPVYQSFIGREIGALLKGDGETNANAVPPKHMALWFALDRFAEFKSTAWRDYDFVLLNRYVLSNAVYQSARGEDIVDFVLELEHKILSLPEANAYVYFQIPPEIAAINVSRKCEREYLGGVGSDVYESSHDLQLNVLKKYNECAQRFKNIITIEASRGGAMLSPEKIAQRTLKALEENGTI